MRRNIGRILISGGCLAGLLLCAAWQSTQATPDAAADPARVSPTAALTDGSPVVASAPGESDAAGPTTQSANPGGAAAVFGGWVLLPPLVTIVLAIAFRQVVPALFIGSLVAGYMLVLGVHGAPDLQTALLGGLRLTVEDFLIGAIADVGHIQIVLFTLLIGGMVGVLGVNGGTAALVHLVSRFARGRRSGQTVTWGAGLVVFFDDYANSMIVGPSFAPIADRLRFSREKLAYLVDSTAAPVASIALIGTWVGAEIGFIGDGLVAVGDRPAFLTNVGAYDAFLYSIPYRFYAILALVMVLLVGLLNRDFGPMRRAEQRATESTVDGADEEPAAAQRRRASVWVALLPLGTLVFLTLGLLLATGYASLSADAAGSGPPLPTGWALITALVSAGDSYIALLYGAIASLAVAFLTTVLAQPLQFGPAVDGMLEAMSRMFPTIVVLVLAWTLASAMSALQVGEVAGEFLTTADLPAAWLPAVVFVAAAITSFSTGTSWGTMGILCPVVVPVAARLITGDAALPIEQTLPVFYASVGAVLSGAIFGDHCSPISDTTVLSSAATGCSLESHVWTQMPYALVTAVVAMLCGDVLCRQFVLPAWVGLTAGAAALLVILLMLGRQPSPTVRDAETASRPKPASPLQ